METILFGVVVGVICLLAMLSSKWLDLDAGFRSGLIFSVMVGAILAFLIPIGLLVWEVVISLFKVVLGEAGLTWEKLIAAILGSVVAYILVYLAGRLVRRRP